jgi:uncharacterized protein (DUF1778 family)
MSVEATGDRRRARIGLRVDEGDKALLMEAAALEHTTVTGFIVQAACARAEQVLGPHRTIPANADAYDRFVAALDAVRPTSPGSASCSAARVPSTADDAAPELGVL